MFNFSKNSKKSEGQPTVAGHEATELQTIQSWQGDTDDQSLDPNPASVMQAENAEQNTEQPPQKPPKKKSRWWLWLLAGMITGAGTSGYFLYRGWQELEALVPEEVNEVLIYTRPDTLVVKAADGTVIEEVGPVSHEKAKIWEVPEVVSQAFISSEDRRYYEHFGVDTQGIFRAAYVNFQAGEIVEGGSSITQQVARIVFLNQEMTALRKLKEMRLATKLEEEFTKDQILESYLNLVYLGSGAYGVTDAAWVYFGKTLDELTLPEAAMIAGLAPAPSAYSPFVDPQKAITRRNQVLVRMREDGFISQAAMDQAIATPLEMNRQVPKRLLRKYPYFSDYIQAELDRYLTPEQLQRGGVVVETTINPQWQDWAEEVLKNGIEKYGRYQNFKQAAIVSIDPRNGQIKTMVGGLDFENNQYNRVTQAQRQPGSTFKTFVYTAAIASGMSPDKTYVDKPFAIGDYKPKNYSGKFSNETLTLTEALTKSVNTIALNVMLDVGWDPIMNIAKQMGIHSEMKPTYSLALGAWEVNLLEITSAYGTLAYRGVHQPNYGISRILDRDGKVIYEAEANPHKALDETTCAIVTSMLTKVVESGTGRQANISRPVAGKTGTSDEARDLWFIGFIPQMVTGIWLGNDNNKPTQGASSTAAKMWGDLMGQITKSIAVENFPPVPNIKNRVGSIAAVPLRNVKKPNSSIADSENADGNKTTQNSAVNTNGGNRGSNEDSDYATGDRPQSGKANNANTYKPPAFDYSTQPETVPEFVPIPKESAATPAPTPTPAPAPTPAPTPAPAPVAPAADIPAPPVVQKKAPAEAPAE